MTPQRAQPLPQLTGVPKEAAEEIRNLAKVIQRLTSRIAVLEGAGFITAKQAEAKYSPTVMAQALQATGSAPLNVVTVSGQTFLQAQPTKGR